MKKLMAWLVILSVGMFTIGCSDAGDDDGPIKKDDKATDSADDGEEKDGDK